MTYRLAPDLSYTLLGGEPYFLDVGRDRYFRLDGALRRAFLLVAAGGEPPPAEGAALVAQGVLAPADGAPGVAPASVAVPARSVLETFACCPAEGLAAAPEVALRLSRAARALRRAPLGEIIRRRSGAPRPAADAAADEETARLAARFAAARLLVPAPRACLPDTLALLDFLAQRGRCARIVFGVRRDPFAAHCWAQSDGWLLNETVGGAAAFAPIGAAP